MSAETSTAPGFAPASPSSCALSVRNLCVRLEAPTGAREILQGLSFELAPGEIGSLLGASGCGKTTALRAIAGFVQPWQGEILIAARTVASPAISIAPEHRGVGVVFQDYALFPHLTLAGNVAFGLRQASPAQRKARVGQLLEMVGLSGSADRYPHELSGGNNNASHWRERWPPRLRFYCLMSPFQAWTLICVNSWRWTCGSS